ncbi:MAG: hypothetical protein ACRC6V_06535 [Bacteroidales bacterium]
MNQDKLISAMYKIKGLMEEGDLPFILDEMKDRIAKEIGNTEPEEVSKREAKYGLILSIRALEKEFQGYINEIERLEENK